MFYNETCHFKPHQMGDNLFLIFAILNDSKHTYLPASSPGINPTKLVLGEMHEFT